MDNHHYLIDLVNCLKDPNVTKINVNFHNKNQVVTSNLDDTEESDNAEIFE